MDLKVAPFSDGDIPERHGRLMGFCDIRFVAPAPGADLREASNGNTELFRVRGTEWPELPAMRQDA